MYTTCRSVTAVFGLAIAIATVAGAAEPSESAVVPPLNTDADYCATMQQFIAGTRITPETIQYSGDDYDIGFKKSKPTAQPLVIHQYVGYQTPSGKTQAMPVTVSCKLKTAERIRTAHAGLTEDAVAADKDRTCQQWTEAMLDAVYEAVDGAAGAGASSGTTSSDTLLSRERVRLEKENNVYIGPLWVNPFPFQAAYQEGGNLHLRSKALHAEYMGWMPLPDSFMGTHYCHTIAPEYLQALLKSELEAPGLE